MLGFLFAHNDFAENFLEIMKMILGKKIGMSQIFDSQGSVVPVTFIEAGPVTVIQRRTPEKDGYDAVQVGFGTRNKKNIAKPQRKHFGDLGTFRFVRELRPTKKSELPDVGSTIDISIFKEGEIVKVSGTTKSKGFQGVVKRHGFAGHNSSHGTKHAKREPGSIGGGLRTRVPSGMRMGGRMGGERVTIQRLKVVAVDVEKNILIVNGAVPGIPGGLLEIRGM
ncbi:MAG: 50S ribosomal protein L3 [Patescibacteria group bacterium]